MIDFLNKIYRLFLQSGSARWALFFLLLPLVTGTGLSYFAIQQAPWLMTANPIIWLFLFILLALPIAFSIIPNTLAGLLAGYFLGWLGFPGMVLSFSLASVLGYFLGKKLDTGFREVVFDIWPGSRQTFDGLKRESIWTVILLRLAPAPPFAVGSLLLSWINCSPGSFLSGSILGMLPRMALVVWLGSQSAQILEIIRNPSQSAEFKWGSLLFLIMALAGFYWLGKKVNKRNRPG